MSKYDKLWQYINSKEAESFILTFDESVNDESVNDESANDEAVNCHLL